jgi:hypothetical protein
MPTKNEFKKKIFCILPVLFESTFTSFFKGTVKSQKEVTQTVEIKVCLTIFA